MPDTAMLRGLSDNQEISGAVRTSIITDDFCKNSAHLRNVVQKKTIL